MSKIIYVCKKCGNESPRPMYGKCPSCGDFQSYEEKSSSQSSSSSSLSQSKTVGMKSSEPIKPTIKAKTISELKNNPIKRISTGIDELDRVLGGGFVEGEVILFYASPGSGKSTLAMHIADSFAQMGKKVLYASGEESEQQIALRASRLGVSSDLIKVVHEISLEKLLGHIEEEDPDFMVVDSIQTLATSEITGSMGSISQSKEVAHRLTVLSKERNIITILIGQATKE